MSAATDNTDGLAVAGLSPPTFSPVKVLVVDEETRPGFISTQHPNGGRYGALWMLVRQSGRPVGIAKVPAPNGDLGASQLDPVIDQILATSLTKGSVALPEDPPLVTVIIPSVLKRQDELHRCIDSLVALDYPRVEIIVVDNRPGPTAPVPDWLSAVPGLHVLHEPTPGISAARNCGLQAANGAIVAFTDDDVIVDPGWAKAIAARFEDHPEEQAVTGLVLPRELETPAQLLLEEYYGGFGPRVFQPVTHRLRRARTGRWEPPTAVEIDDHGMELREFSIYAAGTFGAGANMAFRTEALRSLGGFECRLGIGTPTQGGEDLAVFVQLVWAGASIGFEPAVLAHHLHRNDLASLRRQIEGYGVGYSAMFLALVDRDRSHLAGMMATVPAAFSAFAEIFVEKLRSRPSADPSASGPVGANRSHLARLEIRGMIRGPLAYGRARRLPELAAVTPVHLPATPLEEAS